MKVDYAQVLEGCKRHDSEARRVLYEEFSPVMLGIGIRYLHSRDEAQDLLHDAFIKIFERIGGVKDAGKLRSWMCRVMLTTVVDYLRRSRQTVYVENEYLEEMEEESDAVDTDGYDLESVLEAVRRLPPVYRAVFNMREVDGMEFADIARALGISEGTVRSNLVRARRKLRGELGIRN